YYDIFSKYGLSAKDLLNASCTCRHWNFYIDHHYVSQRLLDRLPIHPPPPANEPWLKTYGYWSQFPKEDVKTTYNYKVGKERMTLVRQNRIEFKTNIRTPRLPKYLWVYKREHLRVSDNKKLLCKVHLIAAHRILQLARDSIDKWGEDGAEKVLSASETGLVYWNILYTFGSFEQLLRKIQEITIKNQQPRG
ncbi:MAG: F-box protein, partial [Waddliaceae bacterium]